MFNYFLLTLFCTQLFISSKGENVCGDWETYKEEKCIKLISTAGLLSFAEAEKTCTVNDNSKLVSIHNVNEQTFLVDYLFTKHSVVDNVWLGAKYYVNSTFHWENNSNLTFSNWAAKNPKIDSSVAQTCVQMHSEKEIRGQWSNEPCAKMNRVVCERGQTWSLAKMQQLLVKVIKNPVPLDFIYVQLPKEKSPQEIWSWMTWTDVSAQYDSTFFRVAGSKAAAFGAVQEEDSPFIDEMRSGYSRGGVQTVSDVKIPRVNSWSGQITTSWLYEGPNTSNLYMSYLMLHTALNEVRPKNMAVKIWKRTG